MTALNWYVTGDIHRWHEYPDCVHDEVIQRACILVNDRLPNDKARERVIGPRLFDPVGTNVPEAPKVFAEVIFGGNPLGPRPLEFLLQSFSALCTRNSLEYAAEVISEVCRRINKLKVKTAKTQEETIEMLNSLPLAESSTPYSIPAFINEEITSTFDMEAMRKAYNELAGSGFPKPWTQYTYPAATQGHWLKVPK